MFKAITFTLISATAYATATETRNLQFVPPTTTETGSSSFAPPAALIEQLEKLEVTKTTESSTIPENAILPPASVVNTLEQKEEEKTEAENVAAAPSGLTPPKELVEILEVLEPLPKPTAEPVAEPVAEPKGFEAPAGLDDKLVSVAEVAKATEAATKGTSKPASTANWIPVWSVAVPVSDYTSGSPYDFGTASSSKNFTQTAQMSFTKKTGLGANKNESMYWIGWTTQLNSRNLPVAGSIMQQWIAPRWVADDSSQYAVYYCSSTTGTTSGTKVTAQSLISTTDIQARTGRAIDTTAGLIQTAPDSSVQQVGKWTAPTTQNWGFLECMTWRSSIATAAGQMTSIKYGDSIVFRAGFKQFANSTTTVPAISISRFDYSFTIVESVSSASTYLQTGAVVIATLALVAAF